MAPARKQKHVKVIKPSSTYVHPSLSVSGSAPSSSTKQDGLSVSERIEYLRRVQTPRLSLQDSDHAPTSSPTVAHGRLRSTARVAGPKPPKSWTDSSLSFKQGSSVGYTYERRPPALDYLPNPKLPPVNSLLHQALKALAMNFEWHREYDHFYLSTLPVAQKSLLLRYIARYGPQDGIDVDDLRLLFSSQREIDRVPVSDDYPLTLDATGSEELGCLDLGGSIGRRCRLKKLDKYWTFKSVSADSPPEQWDLNEDHDSPHGSPTRTIHSSLRFPSLVKLSLAYPGRNASWTDLLHFSRHLGALTHLSLAHWTIPRTSSTTFAEATAVPSVAATASASSESIYSTSDLDDAVDALHQLSRNTPSLRYLSLAGCETWYRALSHVSTIRNASIPQQYNRPPPAPAPRTYRRPGTNGFGGDESGESERFVDFSTSGPWRHIKLLDLTQSVAPPPRMRVPSLWNLYADRGGGRGGEWSRGNVLRPATLSRVARAAHLELRPSGTAGGEGEYRIVAPDEGVAEAMKRRERARTWQQRECDALDVHWFVQAMRACAASAKKTSGAAEVENSRGPFLEVIHGWGKVELLDAGYDEGELFEAGF